MDHSNDASAQHRSMDVNGIRMHGVEQGSGPVVLLCHGFPESWYSWRHQLPALAAAGFRAVAPDMRGYGQTDRPEAVERYSMLHLVGDMLGLLDALEVKSAAVVGHDWGAPVAWNAALLRPDRFRAVAALSVPFRPRASARPTTLMPQTPELLFYQLYFQQPGVEAEFERDVRRTLRAFFAGASGEAFDGVNTAFNGMVSRSAGLFSAFRDDLPLPAWVTAEVLDHYVSEFTRTGFGGGLNWYRNIDRSWELSAPFHGLQVTVPALFIAGERDPVMRFPGSAQTLAQMPRAVPGLRGSLLLPGCGHWTQQERPSEVNDALIGFLRGIEFA